MTSTGVPADNHTYAYTALNQLQKADNQNTCQVLRPGTGSFLSVDPAYDETQSRYGYVDGDPLNSTDLNRCWRATLSS